MSDAPILVTGGAGFIGSCFVLEWLDAGLSPVVNLDLLTYAGNPDNLASLEGHAAHHFVRGDIGDRALLKDLFARHRPRAVLHFAAESHVDRSLHGPAAFIQTNVAGTCTLLEEARGYWEGLAGVDREGFRFIHVSTDEVYGSLTPEEPAFTEQSPYRPSSPYAASKAASDHLARAFRHSWGLPVIVTNCSNNYGPRQFPEKLIPLMIHNALHGKPLPVYGDGRQVRDWLHVSDHCSALRRVLEAGLPGETYNIGGNSERVNLDVVRTLCATVDARAPEGAPREKLIRYVTDRPGHDRRYAIDAGKIARELGWTPRRSFEEGLAETVDWYLGHRGWVERVTSGAYRDWVAAHYGPEGGQA